MTLSGTGFPRIFDVDFSARPVYSSEHASRAGFGPGGGRAFIVHGEKNIPLSDLKEKILEVVDNVGVRELQLDDAFLEEFCELTGHDHSYWVRRNEIPAGFFMTLASPIITQVFLSFFLKHPNLVKGVIHTGSEIEMYRPIRLDRSPYGETLEMRHIEEKTGEKGKYLAVDLELVLKDSSGEKVAADLHRFFLRI